MLFQHRLESVVDLGAPAQRLAEARRPDRGHHELLDVDSGVRVGAAVEDVHHRHRQDVRIGAAEIAEQRQLGGVGGRLADRQGYPEDGVGAQPRLVRGAVEVQQRLIDQALIVGVESDDGWCDFVEHGLHGLLHALAAVALAAVPQLDGLMLAGRRAGGHRGPCECPVDEGHLDLDRRIAARIEDLAGSDLLDNRH